MAENTTITNCIVTGSDAIIEKHYVIDKKSDLYKKYSGYSEGIVLSCESGNVYNQFPGRIMIVNFDKNRYDIVVQMDSNNCMKYSNLVDCVVRKGQDVVESDLLGRCKKSVIVEYCSTSPTNNFPLRILDTTFYKHDPEPVLISGVYSGESYISFDTLSYQDIVDTVDVYIDSDEPNGDPVIDYSIYVPDFNIDIIDNVKAAKQSGDYLGGDV